MPAPPQSGASRPSAAGRDPLRLVRFLDVVLLVLAAPLVIVLGAPVLGFAVGAGAWAVQRVISTAVEAHVREMDFRRGIALQLTMALARAFAVAGAILLVGILGARVDGLAAGITVLAAFTVYFALNLVLRPLESKSSAS
jgi:hypothetical protein